MIFRHSYQPAQRRSRWSALSRPNNSRSLLRKLQQLDLVCRNHAHPLPCTMTFIGKTHSNRGQSVAMYACPLCNYREGWVQDQYTGKPHKLFYKPGKRRA